MSKPMTVKETAEYLGRSEWKIYEMVRRKQIPHFRIGAGISFRKEAIDSWIASQEAANVQGVVINEIQVEQPIVQKSFRVLGGNAGPVRRIGGH